jgi:hypothetical protein
MRRRGLLPVSLATAWDGCRRVFRASSYYRGVARHTDKSFDIGRLSIWYFQIDHDRLAHGCFALPDALEPWCLYRLRTTVVVEALGADESGGQANVTAAPSVQSRPQASRPEAVRGLHVQHDG